MATNYTHPGIYIQEVPSARTIQGASTSVPAFIGVTGIYPGAGGTPVKANVPTLVTSWNAYQRQFGNLLWNGMVSWAVSEFFTEGGTSCYVVRAQDKNNAQAATVSQSGITLTAVTPGTWPNNTIGFVVSNSDGSDPKTPTQVFNLAIVADKDKLTALPANSVNGALQAYCTQNSLTTVQAGGKSYYVLESFNGYTKDTLNPQLQDAINAGSMFVHASATNGARPPNTNAAPPQMLNNGGVPNWLFEDAWKTLSAVQGVSLLAMPDTVNITDAGGNTINTLQQAATINSALLFCDQPAMRNLFYAVDPPFGQTVQEVNTFKTGGGTAANAPPAINSTYGALYYPWVSIYNSMDGTNVPIPPSGPALGRYAYTDSSAGVWKSPAGVNDGLLASVVQVQQTVTDADQDTLNPNGINAIRNLLGYGNVIYGARTLAALGSEWTYVSVRRLFIYVEQSLKQSLQWVVFEPNDQTTWAAVTRDISAFLTTIWQAGGLFGATAAEAFFVTCNETNNPPETRALGQMYIDVGLAPVYPAEFVIIRMTQKVAGPDSGS
ncbi:phage tail sheath C-terminal domain-containing protein [Trinickia sp. YCB016]